MKYITNLIAIGVIAFLVFGAIKFKQTDAYSTARWHVSNFFKSTKNFVEAKKKNISEELKPSRQRPLTFMQIQGELQNWMPEVFLEQFGDSDWELMWNLVYIADKVDDGGFKVYRYKTREEVESILRYEYTDLNYLKDNDWRELWSIAKVSW
ncbi:MAG: hypothetical protein K9L86_03260 [Candidatus Omnitrophica bacterium]|nr:hypothetical protein [Candidatus Omnitrophota bacterium]